MKYEIAGPYASPRWTTEFADCAIPMSFDTYSTCGFGCFYCFSQFQRGIGKSKDDYVSRRVKAVSPKKFIRLFGPEYTGQFSDYIRQRKVFQWGGLSDPFCTIEQQLGVGLEILRFMREIKYPICFSTKGAWWTEDARYMDLFKGADHFNVKVSIITLSKSMASRLEPGVPSPGERLKAIRRLTKARCGEVTLRLRPFIPGASDRDYLELIDRAADAGATALSTEFMCYEVRSAMFKEKAKAASLHLGFDLDEYYKRYSKGAGYLRLNRNLKRPYIDAMEERCKRNGMRFYVSDAHFKERCANGCCCGLPPSWNYSRGQWGEALQIAKEKGEVSWCDIADEMSFASGVRFGSAHGFNKGPVNGEAAFRNLSLQEFFHRLWNNPKSKKGIYYQYGGILAPTRIDLNGDVVYAYQKDRE